MLKKKLYIEGMCCTKCPDKIKKSLESIEDIKSVEIDNLFKTATIKMENDIEASILKDVVRQAGHYDIKNIEVF